MYGIFRLPEPERRTIFRNTAQKMNIHEAIIEKDYWVCLVLDYLFHKCRFQKHFSFKGGTSLSKCFDLIKRFSEDIDLMLDWRLLGYEKDEPWRERTNTKQDAFNKQANMKTKVFIVGVLLPTIESDLTELIGQKVDIQISSTNPQTIDFNYPMLFDNVSITQSIRLEVGALAAWTPAVVKKVTPYIFECYPDLDNFISTTVLTSSAERTFWEKATILHHEANRPEHLDMPERYSRHYYDLYCIGNTPYLEESLKQSDLLEKVVAFKIKFYPRKWAHYNEAVPGTIKLIPPKYRFDALRNDYTLMAEMLFGDYPSFEELMNGIARLEKTINIVR